jgi:hypothetical protein
VVPCRPARTGAGSRRDADLVSSPCRHLGEGRRKQLDRAGTDPESIVPWSVAWAEKQLTTEDTEDTEDGFLVRWPAPRAGISWELPRGARSRPRPFTSFKGLVRGTGNAGQFSAAFCVRRAAPASAFSAASLKRVPTEMPECRRVNPEWQTSSAGSWRRPPNAESFPPCPLCPPWSIAFRGCATKHTTAQPNRV